MSYDLKTYSNLVKTFKLVPLITEEIDRFAHRTQRHP